MHIFNNIKLTVIFDDETFNYTEVDNENKIK